MRGAGFRVQAVAWVRGAGFVPEALPQHGWPGLMDAAGTPPPARLYLRLRLRVTTKPSPKG